MFKVRRCKMFEGTEVHIVKIKLGEYCLGKIDLNRLKSESLREETRSGSTTTHANYSLPENDSFLFEIEPDQGGITSVVISNNDLLLESPEFESFHFDIYDVPHISSTSSQTTRMFCVLICFNDNLLNHREGMDISKIARKQSKVGKHGHENGRVKKSRKQSQEKSNPQSKWKSIQELTSTMAGSNGSNQESSLALKPRGHVRLKKAHGYGEFVLISLSKEAQMSLNMDCHVGNPCEVI
ncbi:hypothetical protein Tco_0557256 [Tanacetum coccineum]